MIKKIAKKTVDKKNKVSTGKVVAITAGVAALGAVAYLLMGPNGKKNQKAVKAWTVKMKAEVAEKIEGMKEITAPIYNKIVQEVADKYTKVKNIDSKDVKREMDLLKKDWHSIVKNHSK